MKHHNIKLRLSLLVAFAAMLLPSSAWAVITRTVNFNLQSNQFPQRQAGDTTFMVITMDSMYNSCETAKPSLPIKYLTFSVPYNSSQFTVTATTPGSSYIPLNHDVMPAQAPETTDSISSISFTRPDSATYNTNSFSPTALASVVSEGYIAGDNHVITVAVSPFRYNPVSDSLEFHSRIVLTINYTTGNASNSAIVPISRNNTQLRNAEMLKVKSQVFNADQVQSFAASANIGNINFNNISVDIDTTAVPFNPDEVVVLGSYNYIIITNRQLAPAFKKIIALKRQKGYSAGTVTIEDIMSSSFYNQGDIFKNSNGATVSVINDSAGCVREYLKSAYASTINPAQFVLMGGKAPYAPIRYGCDSCWVIEKDLIHAFRNSVQYKVPTDLYFCNLTTNWNQDGDNNYGEIGSVFDYNPQLYVGRLLCTNTSEISNYTDKLLRYELNPGNGDYSYLKNAMVCGSNSVQDNATEISSILTTKLSGISKLFLEVTNSIPNGVDVINDWNNVKYGFVSICGHGNPYELAVNNRLAEWPYYDRPFAISMLDSYSGHLQNEVGNGLDCLTNKNYPTILYSIACEPMPFDIMTIKGETYNKTNFGESYTLGKNYGGVAFLGNTREGSTVNSVYLEKGFLRSIDTTNYKVGVAEARSKCYEYITEHHLKLAQNLLGDPEFEMWTDAPSKYTGIIVTRTDNSITVSGLRRYSNKTVAYCSNGYMQDKVNTKATSVTFSNVSPNSSIMVYQHNFIPYIAPLYLQNDTINYSQYVFASTLLAGRNVDSNRTSGNIVFARGVNYEVEATGNVSLGSGLIVRNGATLKIMTPGTVTINGATVERGGKVIIEAGSTSIPLNFNALNGSSVKIGKYTPVR